MEAAQPRGEGHLDNAPHFVDEHVPDESQAWEELEAGRYMPRRIRGSYRGRALG